MCYKMLNSALRVRVKINISSTNKQEMRKISKYNITFKLKHILNYYGKCGQTFSRHSEPL